ncbi:hypothetical protein PPL_01976 [Heterostelium album PN500]|uniref:Cystatin domain-containing protein n=1 Tax=Heterostelium pallidum (strain ATCC 26659 / Pp 5 / PN500) TaxID=670386 RepID=D3B108_HETP5|nr:hypothetical protein PPL_01976 [Heterostelium album PN500]EFA84982.1 hypothetical protein PPL_01976 [Heterostelium album PN500]|eukprot:XP_020437092.1 hypothetical protein PPL_01976 [Heterostelium album PN500]
MGLVNKLIFLIGLGALTYNTNPDKGDFNRQLAKKIENKEGKIASYVLRGVMSVTNPVEVQNCVYFSLATMVPCEANNFSNDVVGVGMFGKWIIFT